jgi:hypothetical protein
MLQIWSPAGDGGGDQDLLDMGDEDWPAGEVRHLHRVSPDGPVSWAARRGWRR